MARLISQPIKSIFNGVSRQPHTVRLPGQVEEADNVLLSVVSGGFEKRPGTQHIAVLNSATANDYAVHTIDRDSFEQYVVLIPGDGSILVYDAQTGVQKTVNALAADAVSYLTGDPLDFAFVSVADYTFVVNRQIVVAMDAAGGGTLKGTKQKFSELPTTGNTVGDVWKIAGDNTNNFDDYYVRWDGSVWLESVAPNIQNSFNANTMPYNLVRESDGTFSFKKGTWADRAVGDTDSVPAPGFVGKTISDVFFHRNRLGFLADETVFYSQAGDYFNLWPDKATEVLDSDPIELAASTTKVTLLNFAVPFRRSLFVTAAKAQFEISALDKLTPETAVIDLSTSYEASDVCRPVAMGDTLYFPSNTGAASVIWEYYWDDDQLSNTANDVTKHAKGYVPSNLVQMAASAVTDRIFLRSINEPSNVYVYTTYWDGEAKVQSAWSRWTFPGGTIFGIATMGDYVYMVVKRGTQVCLEKVTADTETDDPDLGYSVLLDRRVRVTGTYDAGSNTTTWTIPYEHGSALQAVMTGDFVNNGGREITGLTYPTPTTVSAVGDYSAGRVYFGVPYTMCVELSKQFPREGDQSSIITGRCQMRRIAFSFKKSGYFEVEVTPESRETRTKAMTGAILGTGNLVNVPHIIEQGVFKVRVNSRSDTVKIVVKNPSYVPSVITSATWVGHFTDITRE